MTEKKMIVIVVAVVVTVLFLFRGVSSTIKAVTVSGNEIKERSNETVEDTEAAVLDNQKTDDPDIPAVETDKLESEEESEAVSDDTGEGGQAVCMDQDFTDSVLNYINFSYKLQLVQLILIAFILGAVLSLGIMEWFTK